MSVKQISVFLENKPGALYNMSEVLASNNIDMRALSLAEIKDYGIVRIIVNDVYKATTVLKEEGFIHNVTSVLGVMIPDTPGGMQQVLHALQEAEINVEYLYALLGGKGDHAYMIFRVQDNKAAVAALNKNGIRCVDQDDIAQL